jgi:hypothetical protein
MGSSTSNTFILNELNSYVSKTEKQLINLITQTIVNVTHNIVIQQIATLSSDVQSQNTIDISDIIITDGSVLTLEQQNNLKTTISAVLNIVQSNELVTNLSNQIKNDIKLSVTQNTDLNNKLAASSELLKAQNDSGELNKLASEAKNIASAITGVFTTRNVETAIINKIVNRLILDTSTTANVEDYINTKINQTIDQLTINTCVQSNNIFNIINLKEISLETNAKMDVIQENILISFYRCIITSMMKTQDLITLSNDLLNQATIATSQGVKLSNDVSASEKKTDITTNTSYLDSLGGVIVVIIIIILIYGTMKMTKKKED